MRDLFNPSVQVPDDDSVVRINGKVCRELSPGRFFLVWLVRTFILFSLLFLAYSITSRAATVPTAYTAVCEKADGSVYYFASDYELYWCAAGDGTYGIGTDGDRVSYSTDGENYAAITSNASYLCPNGHKLLNSKLLRSGFVNIVSGSVSDCSEEPVEPSEPSEEPVEPSEPSEEPVEPSEPSEEPVEPSEPSEPVIVDINSLVLSSDSLFWNDYDPKVIMAVISPPEASGTIVWESSDENIFSVVDGIITPLADGSAVITAAYTNSDGTVVSDSCLCVCYAESGSGGGGSDTVIYDNEDDFVSSPLLVNRYEYQILNDLRFIKYALVLQVAVIFLLFFKRK